MTPTLFCPAGGEIVLGQIQTVTGFSFSMEWGVCPTGLRLKSNILIVWGLRNQLLKLSFFHGVPGWRYVRPQGCFLPCHFTSCLLWLTHLDMGPGLVWTREVRWHLPLYMSQSLGFPVSSVLLGDLMLTLS